MPKVYNKHHGDAPVDAVYVGRGTVFGNPWSIQGAMTREIVLERYKTYIEFHPTLKRVIRRRLKGKDLICFCAPQACHADILLEIANEEGEDGN